MGWRTVVISSRSKLELKLNYLVVRAEETKRVLIDEISVLVVENTGCSLTAALLECLWRKKIAVIFCDSRRNPGAQLLPLYGSFDTSHKVHLQCNWSQESMRTVWSEIVKEKIRKQSACLRRYDELAADKLLTYIPDVTEGDETNREGFAAKVYFNALFDESFSRGEETFTNACLNYGYAIIMSAISREIVANGYITQIGIFHKNTFNQFNLACDLMEPFRPLVDSIVAEFPVELVDGMSSTEKQLLLEVLSKHVFIDEVCYTVLNAMTIYVKSVLDALEANDSSLIRFYRYEF